MIIVYLSLLLVAIVVIWFIFQLVKVVKGYKKTIVSMAKKAEKVRKTTEETKKHQEKAVHTLNQVSDSFKDSVDDVMFTINQGKNFVTTVSKSKDEIKTIWPFTLIGIKRS